MEKRYLLLGLMLCNIYPTRISIVNWNTFPVTVSEEIVPQKGNDLNLDTIFNIEPGQSAEVQITKNDTLYTNFNRITAEFNVDGHTTKETMYFPDAASEEASLSFSESGYTRSPFNILTGK